MAVHIFRAGLTGKLLFPEEILSYISFRSTTIYSTTIYLLKKKKRINLYPYEQEWKIKTYKRQASIIAHHKQARAQRQEE